MTFDEFRNQLKIGDAIVVTGNGREGKVKLKNASKVVVQMENGTNKTYSYTAIQRKETL